MCGKNPPTVLDLVCFSGSPPRVREKRQSKQRAIERSRITPACAGKTHKHRFYGLNHRDHPRVCGKNVMRRRKHPSISGSPPRVREKPRNCLTRVLKTRITPACAGKTPSTRYLSYQPWDHPRVCGKNTEAKRTSI